MRELIKSFQVVLFTKLSEKTIKLVVQHFIKHEKLLFDGVYCQEPNEGVFANYNQIYLDFEVLKTISFEDFKPVSE